VADDPEIAKRKRDHLEVAASGRADFAKTTLLEHVHLVHQALPELALDEIELATELVGKALRAPLVITGMTGGTAEAAAVNRDLARAAEAAGIALGLGSQRAMDEHPELAASYEVRDVAPDVVLFGNVGGVQALAMGPARVIELAKRIGADALAIHLNPGQELIQEKGDRSFRGVRDGIARIVEASPLPIVVKETGCGLSVEATDGGLGRRVRAREPHRDRVRGHAQRARRRAGARARRAGRRDGGADAAGAARRRRRWRARGDRSGRRVDPQRVPAHRLPARGRSRAGAASPRRAAARLPRGSRPVTCAGWARSASRDEVDGRDLRGLGQGLHHATRSTAVIYAGWGKVILLGEHAVVYGYPALAAALDRGVTIAPVPTPAGGPLRLDIPAWDLSVPASSRDDAHPVARALAAIADELGIGRPAVSLVGDAQIPHSAGLGSSAAMAVAIARALLGNAKRAQDTSVVLAAASASEAVLHGRSSGVDVALAARGGIGVFRKRTGLRAIAIPALRVLVAPSGAPRSTAAMVERVAQATASGRTHVASAPPPGNGEQPTNEDARLVELGNLTDAGTTALLARDLEGLGVAMNRAHAVLAGLGVSTEQLDSLCEAARATGAYGAKLTGAGGGGAVIAIAPRDREGAILAEWRNAGVTGFVSTIGGDRA